MKSKERLPGTDDHGSSKDRVAWQATREAETISDTEHLKKIELLLKKKISKKDLRSLIFIISWIIHNTGNAHAKEVYLSIPWEDADDYTMMNLIDGAIRADLIEYIDRVRQMIKKTESGSDHYSSAIEYFGKIGKLDALHDIGSELDADCSGHFEPFICCTELARIGSTDAIPYLERAIERHQKGRKQWQKQTIAWSTRAIERIQNNEDPATPWWN
ncbi:hypothetical protein [Rubellicoccus peritrichatus]|uniref:Uncharacterized protein n=1 Tax=Rubellicoccus peritrichatus TaxID=3080537 RepID=A0AAQ3L6E0_9BACT|nr:hypothetical protein [Puniceicoccus sp. CR14]WOO40349.1 hypothetical protein RZN69_17155 [Puniceicoccus sp. CR14]